MIETDENGFVAIRLEDQFIGETVVAAIRKGGKLIKLQSLTPSEDGRGETTAALDPADAHIDLVIGQDERTCRSGKSCAFSISVSNTGNGIYEGPVFIEGALQGDWITASARMDDLYCGRSRSGKTLCSVQLSLEPGAEAGYLVNVPLPRQMKASSRSCIAFVPMEPMAATRSTPIMEAIQLGLSHMGYQPGRADGIDGPKTQNAIASFLQQQRLEAPGNNEQLFEMLYQYPFRKLARLGISDKTNCIRIALAKPASPVYRARQPAPVMRQDIRPQNRNTREEAIGRVLGMGLAIGIGILNNGHSREPRRPRYNGPME